MSSVHPIGVFDSGFGGLTVLREIEKRLPYFDYLYLGDNARAPYGNRSFETVYGYTREAVTWLFGQGCRLVILACNTASAKALRTIQQNDLPDLCPGGRVLGVIRPVTERIGAFTTTGHIGILGTAGTVESRSYVIEIEKYFPHLIVTQEACPMWVPLIENGEAESAGADYFVRQHINRVCAADPLIDAMVLGCTHYPLLEGKIGALLPAGISIISQGEIVAQSLEEYFGRHPEIERQCSKGGGRSFYTSEKARFFEQPAAMFYGKEIRCSEMRFD